MEDAITLKRILDALVRAVVATEEVELPEYRYDGEEVKRPEEVAAILGIPLSEARYRLAAKDVYTGGGSIPARPQRLALIQRGHRLAMKKPRKKKEKE